MNSFKRALRLLGLICLMLLAMLGIGLSGGVPPTTTNRRKDPVEYKIELEEHPEKSKKVYDFEKQE